MRIIPYLKIFLAFLLIVSCHICVAQKKKKGTYTQKAMELYKSEDYEKAVPAFDKAINSTKKKDQEMYKLYLYRAVSKSRTGDYYGSYNDINTCLKLNPFYAEAYIFRGMLNLLMDSEKEALTDFNKATEAEPENFYAWIYMADLYYEMKDYEMAAESYSKALNINPNDEDARAKRADIWYLLKKYEKAIEDYDHILELMPENGDAYYMRGLSKTYIANTDTLGACEDIKRAKELGTNTDMPGLEEYCNE
ncbi:tetratricopeptide repeat protein [Cytophagaceae bacterium ABcell3]|nr:tetratricopeptide repeat protein [Cytophagaceae bacterium ABcell3]